MARTMEEVLAAVKAASGRTQSLIEYSAGQKARVEELLAKEGVNSPAIDAGLDEIFDIETADAAKIDAAIAAPNPPPAA